jgi:hypothetical protein
MLYFDAPVLVVGCLSDVVDCPLLVQLWWLVLGVPHWVVVNRSQSGYHLDAHLRIGESEQVPLIWPLQWRVRLL